MRAHDGPSLARELAAEIRDERVLDAIAAVPRELFVPEDLRDRAYANRPLPIGAGQTISQPLVVARMAELLELAPGDRVLDVGTGSGYHAAVLARLAGPVWSIERHAELAAAARRALAAAGVTSVTCLVGDGSRGLPEHAPYDAINVAAAAREDDLEPLEEQLAPGGRLVAPVARLGRGQRLVRSVRPREGGPVRRERLEAVRFVPLVADGA